MPTDSIGATALDTFSTGVRVGLSGRMARRDWLIEKFGPTHARVKTVTKIATGE